MGPTLIDMLVICFYCKEDITDEPNHGHDCSGMSDGIQKFILGWKPSEDLFFLDNEDALDSVREQSSWPDHHDKEPA